jgi:hypothetical protein
MYICMCVCVCVCVWQVAGPTALAVSRAIGDILMKEPRKLVISDPEIKTIDLLPQVHQY